MSYYAFKITRMPKRVSLYFGLNGEDELILNQSYSTSREPDIKAGTFLGFPAEPLDDFGYQIQHSKESEWSDEINFTFNVIPEAGTPTCTGSTEFVLSESIHDITHLFIFDTKSDRIRIDSITGGNNNMFVQGQPVVYGQEYMVYDFVNVTFHSGTPDIDSSVNLSTINFTMGKKDLWGSSCSAVLDLLVLAEIASEGILQEQSVPVFERKIFITNGIPGTQVLVKITPSSNMTSFSVAYTDFNEIQQNIPLNTTGSTEVAFDVNSVGKVDAVISGYPTLPNDVDPYLLVIECEILTSAGLTNYVHPVNYILSLFITNDIDLLDSFTAIGSVVMDNAEMVPTANSYTFEAEAPSDIDITAEIRLTPNIGTPPFTYDIELESGPMTPSIVQQTTTPIFDITGMIGATDPGAEFIFKATSVDADNVTSTFFFDFTVLDVVVVEIPVVTGPPSVSVQYNEFVSYYITATNGPITLYSAVGLPTGVNLNTSTGLISGAPTVSGNFDVTLNATNSAGTSINFTWNILVASEVIIVPPVITSDAFVTLYSSFVAYEITYTGSPAQINISGLPAGWYFNPTANFIYGSADIGTYYDMTITATNIAGQDTLNLTIYRSS